MSVLIPNAPLPDLEAGETPSALASVESSSFRRQRRRRRRRRPRPYILASSETTPDGSFRFSFSDTDDEEGIFSTDSDRISVIAKRRVCGNDEVEEDLEIVDLETGQLELKVPKNKSRGKKRKECRICHLKASAAVSGGGDQSFIQLGCCCKGDLGSAHKLCAETWFKIKGNTTCEICGATAVNIAGEQTIEVTVVPAVPAPAPAPAPAVFPDTRTYCHGRRLMNFLLACMVFAFIISWLFHFKILP